MSTKPPKRRKVEHNSSSDGDNDTASSRSAASQTDESSAESNISDDVPQRKGKPFQRHNGRHKLDMAGIQAGQRSLLQMQIAELLTDLTPNYASRQKKASGLISSLKSLIERIPARRPVSLSDAEKMLQRQGVAIPFPSHKPPTDAKYKFGYEKPSKIITAGSFALETDMRGSGSSSSIDLHVMMPASLLETKDYLDHRYFYKRAYYLACIAAGITNDTTMSFQIDLSSQNQNPLQPVLLITPRDAQGIKFPAWSQLRVLVGPPSTVFQADKIAPWAICLRTESVEEDGNRKAGATPSPHYNGTICSEAHAVSYQELLSLAKKQAPGFQTACRLFRIWFSQRQLGSEPSQGGFGNFEASACMALMILGGSQGGVSLLARGTAGFQIFRALIQLLATKDVAEQPLVLGSSSDELEHLKELGLPIIWDATRQHNIAFKMTTSSLSRLRLECQLTNQALSQPPLWRFYPAFIARVNQSIRSDHVFRIQGKACRSFDPVYLSSLHATLLRALGDRIRYVHVDADPVNQRKSWGLEATPPSLSFELVVNITANPENVYRRLDLGPSAEDKDSAAEFRALWGEKSELRRFKDGSIRESVTWPAVGDDRTALVNVIEYILNRHFNVSPADSAKLIPMGRSIAELTSVVACPSSEAFAPYKAVTQAVAELENAIREHSGQPLHVRSLSAASPTLRYSSIYPNGQHSAANGEAVNDIVLQYEGSVRWPDDFPAIQHTKIALLVQLSKLLAEKKSYTCLVGLENERQDLLNIPFLDVIHKGHLFRIRIHHDREAALIERLVKDKSESHITRTTAASALAAHKRNFIHAPLYSQALTALITRFPLLSPTIRLLKMWISAHLLAPHFPAELLEHLAAHVFTFPYPYPRPGSLQTAFLRILAFLARWDWQTEPLLVNFDPDHIVRGEVVEEVSTRFEAWRKVDPAMHRVAMFVASTKEHDGTVWTLQRPSLVAANRLTALAKGAYSLIESQGLDFRPEPFFAASLVEYDFVIHLNPQATNPRALNNQFDTIITDEREVVGKAGFDAVRLYLEELEDIFADCVALFYGLRPLVGGVWNPEARISRNFRITAAYSSAPVPRVSDSPGEAEAEAEETPISELNKAAILNEMARLGGKLVTKIVRQDTDESKMAT